MNQLKNGRSIPTFANLYIERRVRRRDGVNFHRFRMNIFDFHAFRSSDVFRNCLSVGRMEGRMVGRIDGWMDERGPTDGRNNYGEKIMDRRAYLVSP